MTIFKKQQYFNALDSEYPGIFSVFRTEFLYLNDRAKLSVCQVFLHLFRQKSAENCKKVESKDSWEDWLKYSGCGDNQVCPKGKVPDNGVGTKYWCSDACLQNLVDKSVNTNFRNNVYNM
jgi:hypothetical protein